MRIGLIGLKGHQSVVLIGAKDLGGWQVVAVADDDSAEVERLVRNEPLARGAERYADWRHLIEHTLMDVCVVCDENSVRAEQVIALADRHIHMIVEKPLTTTLADLDRMRDALERSRSKLTMLLTMRHEAKYCAIRNAVQSGAIGEVAQVSGQKSYRLGERPEWFKHRERLGGIIPYIGIHMLDMIRWTTGLDYTRITALQGAVENPQLGETEGQASVLARMTNGASVSVRLDYLRPAAAPTHGDDRLRIAGTKGIIESRADLPQPQLITADRAPQAIEVPAVESFFAAFAKSLQAGTPFTISTADCLSITEIVLRARESAERGEWIKLR